MPSQDLQSSLSEWKRCYTVKRINEQDIHITAEQRNMILKAINTPNLRFIQIGEYTLLLNGIKSIEPRWNGGIIPPRPRVNRVFLGITENNTVKYEYDKEDTKILDEWIILYENKLV